MPLIAIYNPKSPSDHIFFHDTTPNKLFEQNWEYTKSGFKLKVKNDSMEGPIFSKMPMHANLKELIYDPDSYVSDPKSKDKESF